MSTTMTHNSYALRFAVDMRTNKKKNQRYEQAINRDYKSLSY